MKRFKTVDDYIANAENIASAKRDATKQKRIEKVLPMIAAGAGLHDKYRNC